MSIKVTRRQLIKILAAATGTAVLSSVPNKWQTPIVEVGVLPAHAQGSLTLGTITGHIFDSTNMQGSPKNPKDGLPGIPGITVTIDGNPSHSGTSDSNGFYSITNLPAGTYDLTCDPGFPYCPSPKHITGVIVTTGGTTANQDFSFSQAC